MCQEALKYWMMCWRDVEHNHVDVDTESLDLSVKQPKKNTFTPPSELHNLFFFHLNFSVESLTS